MRAGTFPHWLTFVLRFAVAGLALAFLVVLIWPRAGARLRAGIGLAEPAATSASVTPAVVDTPQILAGNGRVSYSDAVASAAPAVVNIYANKVVTERQVRIYPDPLMRRLFGGVAYGPEYKRREQSLGSGVIFSTEGYVLTNNHVIAGADNIQILLYDGRVAEAEVVGTDAETDLAVLKIATEDLPQIRMARNDQPEVGDVVLAIGNPFGIGQTVTMGIVSATNRQLGRSRYEDFIQTDAAINAGNSGGALVNAKGELIGINTAMFGHGAGAEGIGFAIPIDTASMVLEQIVDHGMVIRGWIGAAWADVLAKPGAAPPTTDNGEVHGVVVLGVYAGSPAARAGLRRGDILLQLNDQPIIDSLQLRSREAALKPGTKVTLSGRRGDEEFQLSLILVQRPAKASPQAQ